MLVPQEHPELSYTLSGGNFRNTQDIALEIANHLGAAEMLSGLSIDTVPVIEKVLRAALAPSRQGASGNVPALPTNERQRVESVRDRLWREAARGPELAWLGHLADTLNRALAVREALEQPRCTCPEEQTWGPMNPSCPVHDAATPSPPDNQEGTGWYDQESTGSVALREALELMVKEWRWYAGKHGSDLDRRLQYALEVVERALEAPAGVPEKQDKGE